MNTKDLKDLAKRGKIVRDTIMKAEFPVDLDREITGAYHNFIEKRYGKNADVAVRQARPRKICRARVLRANRKAISAFAAPKGTLRAVRATMASLFTDRAISYRADRGFDHLKIALSVGVQKMVRSDKACSGVMFTLDTESGFPNVVFINGSWGLGEMIVKGEVTPDEFFVWKEGIEAGRRASDHREEAWRETAEDDLSAGKQIQQTKIIPTSPIEQTTFVLTDEEVAQLATWGTIVEKHYTDHYKKWTPMDMEWAKDGVTGELFIVQARPETVNAGKDFSKLKEYLPLEKKEPVVMGASVGSKIATGKAHIILDAKHIRDFKKGEVLVTTMTDPDWEPIMKMAAAIVTDKGGRTSHAAIVSRELGIPAIVGSENGDEGLKDRRSDHG